MNQTAIINFLNRQQQSDGSFLGYASSSVSLKKPWRQQPTIFPTVLILDCLQPVAGANTICQAAAQYVEQQVQQQGSWNYWNRQYQASCSEPYPDDLDDTACALAALTRQDAPWITSGRLGQFARLLVAAEQSVGGPYNTWLIDVQAAPQWRQIDVVVNANVGYALSLHGAMPAGLRQYLKAAIERAAYTSAYYIDELPVLYFLSRIAELQPDLRPAIEMRLVSLPDSPLQQALLLSAACRVRSDRQRLKELASRLKSELAGDHWPAEAFYIDPVYGGKQHYGGSEALTTAFALEALGLYAEASVTPAVEIVRRRILSAEVRQDIARLPSVYLRQHYTEQARRMVGNKQVSAPATLVRQAGFRRVPATTVAHLNAASLHGWLAYTLYDNILDGDSAVEQLAVANCALRRSLDHFMRAAGQQYDFIEYVSQVFDRMDAANSWEMAQARSSPQPPLLAVEQLPDYDDYGQLAERSLGHSLAACGMASLQYHSMQHPNVQRLQTFFKHFLIARQLNDDAHDWEADLRAGHLSAVVTLLLQHDAPVFPHTYKLAEDMDGLRQQFWRQTIDTVAELIFAHTHTARQALEGFDARIQTDLFETWLRQLEVSAEAARRGRDEALRFMEGYEATHV